MKRALVAEGGTETQAERGKYSHSDRPPFSKIKYWHYEMIKGGQQKKKILKNVSNQRNTPLKMTQSLQEMAVSIFKVFK